ncbi:MAG: Arc family DNA-binding protein [Tannerellaceae bacterium]|jgi:hypothetical protein|nr:Arc family DNA-binding protein [Tannerellaceae bacterium]
MPRKDTANKTFILRIDPAMMEALEQWAADEFRSINGQILYVLAEALRKSGRIQKGENSKKTHKE